MGKSAKVCKRLKKPVKNAVIGKSLAIQQKKKESSLKTKASSSAHRKEGESLLGGADYVTVAMGGRRKAREEARKLPVDKDKMDQD